MLPCDFRRKQAPRRCLSSTWARLLFKLSRGWPVVGRMDIQEPTTDQVHGRCTPIKNFARVYPRYPTGIPTGSFERRVVILGYTHDDGPHLVGPLVGPSLAMGQVTWAYPPRRREPVTLGPRSPDVDPPEISAAGSARDAPMFIVRHRPGIPGPAHYIFGAPPPAPRPRTGRIPPQGWSVRDPTRVPFPRMWSFRDDILN